MTSIKSLKFISILTNYNKKLLTNDIIDLSFNYPIFGRIIFMSSPEEKRLDHNLINIHFAKKEYFYLKSCGEINKEYFSCNNINYQEANKFNSCLHKKIAIDKDGNIKNCPSMPQSFGNIKDTTLEEALNHQDFKKYWNLTKDNIEVCKDCEFRYICTDCRAYTERTHTNSEGLDISKPLKCGYNPYTGEWEEWSTNPLKEKAIKYYGMEDLIKRNEN